MDAAEKKQLEPVQPVVSAEPVLLHVRVAGVAGAGRGAASAEGRQNAVYDGQRREQLVSFEGPRGGWYVVAAFFFCVCAFALIFFSSFFAVAVIVALTFSSPALDRFLLSFSRSRLRLFNSNFLTCSRSIWFALVVLHAGSSGRAGRHGPWGTGNLRGIGRRRWTFR